MKLFHDAEDVFQRLGIQLFRLCYKCLERLRAGVPLIKKLLGGHTEVLTDIEESLHGGQGFLVFDIVDIVACPSDRDISRADTPFCILSFASRSGKKSSYIALTSTLY